MQFIEGQDRYQYQLSSSLDETIDPDHPVRIIDMIIEAIVSKNQERYEKVRETETGRPKYRSAEMLKLYIYGYFNGISSSRKLEVETYRNKEVIWLLGNLRPDHWTISNYRKENGEIIKYVTKKFREFLRDKGYISLKTVAIDGSKVKANANREMLSIEKIEKKLTGIDKKIEEYLQRVSESDMHADLLDEGEENNGTEGNNKYLDKIISLQKQVEELRQQKEHLEKEKINYVSPTDPTARLMRGRDGKIPGYNVQIAVDAENKMIADSEVVTEQTDLGMLPVMVESIKEELGKVPEEIEADKGYSNPDIIESVEKKEKGIKIYIPLERTRRESEEIKFEYNAEKDEYICSAGKRLTLFIRNKQRRNSAVNVYRGIECEGCPLRNKCTKSKKGRNFERYLNQQWRDNYKKKMSSELGKRKTANRKTLAEHPFGTIKYLMGKIPLLLRGMEKVTTEINLYVTVYNLKRLLNIEKFENLKQKIENYRWEMA
jgi:transposase